MAIEKQPLFASGNQGDQDGSDKDAGNPSIDEIMDEEFEEVDDDDEDDSETGSSDDDEGGEQEDDSGDESKEKQAPTRKWAGEFNTPEEMEAAFIRNLKQEPRPEEKQQQSQAIPDLTDTELNTMSEQDTQDGTNFMEEYLRRKMMERNLEKHEIAALRRIDNEKGTDLQGDYHELRAVRAVNKANAPMAKKVHEENTRAFHARERAIDETNVKEFGDSLKTLEKFVSSPKNVEAILQQSPIAGIIIREHENGSQATAHKLLLREAYAFNKMKSDGDMEKKNRMSVRADAGGQSKPRKTSDSAATVEEAFEMAEAEQDQE